MLPYIAPLLCVLKVLCIVLIGCVIVRRMSIAAPSTKGISYIASKVFLPYLIFANLPKDLSIQVLADGYYWCFILLFVQFTIGLISGWIACRLFLKRKDLCPLIYLCTLFPNSIAFGLSIILSLDGLSWFTLKQKDEAKMCTFMYGILSNIGLWGCGEFLVKMSAKKYGNDMEIDENGKRVKIAECEKRDKNTFIKAWSQLPINGSIILSPDSPKALWPKGKLGEDATSPWENTHSMNCCPTLFQAEKQEQRSFGQRIKHNCIVLKRKVCRRIANNMLWQLLVDITHNVTPMMSMVGILFGIIPPTHYIFHNTKLGEFIIGALLLLGNGTVPIFILILGMSLSSSAKTVGKKKTCVVPETVNVDQEVSNKDAKRGKKYDSNFEKESVNNELIDHTESCTSKNSGNLTGKDDKKVIFESKVNAKTLKSIGENPFAESNENSTEFNGLITKKKGIFARICDNLPSLEPPPAFVAIIIFNRLFLGPAFFIIILLGLYKIFPKGTLPETTGFRMCVLAMSSTPGATGATVLVNLFSYRSLMVSQTLLVEYVVALFTTTGWLFVYIYVIENNLCIKQ